ncbi:uncharacterized protein PGTG_22448 [Puccinia graminis f. sp. tritici CRL 75-36-700-3]|uniref:Uncharacterized protein n=1 Tax=Puccinia graminis f. sp. tritici (strain CRL 75-36-700-3 / race SCCL) TaxID=418459 RepID=H6QUH0_PUCGT|nr:uncharacterized protein PGTG_22448 [Puccinia graminis f. sp. tritici CRL 75-36-700-3]EHS64632.1 hypothetical protein PGTG_22448 [Puccinia graminis f. sp. tritici CRL 75-36-700-3]
MQYQHVGGMLLGSACPNALGDGDNDTEESKSEHNPGKDNGHDLQDINTDGQNKHQLTALILQTF